MSLIWRNMKKKQENKKKKHKEIIWIASIFVITFILSAIFGLVSNSVVNNFSTFYAIITTIVIILIGVCFDMVGVAVVSDAEHSHHARAAKKHRGAKESLFVIKHADKVSNIVNDVVGDICGVLSGTLGAVIAISLSATFDIDLLLISVVVGAIVASLTVGGKAIGKAYAIKNSKSIVERVGKIINLFYKMDKKK